MPLVKTQAAATLPTAAKNSCPVSGMTTLSNQIIQDFMSFSHL